MIGLASSLFLIAFRSRDYFLNSIAIGSPHAVRNGIVAVSAAGNEGPEHVVS